MSKGLKGRDYDKQFGQRYAQLLKESSQSPAVYKDCKEVIEASLSFMEHYNRLSLAIQKKIPSHAATATAFS
jgi:hypothetical protein